MIAIDREDRQLRLLTRRYLSCTVFEKDSKTDCQQTKTGRCFIHKLRDLTTYAYNNASRILSLSDDIASHTTNIIIQQEFNQNSQLQHKFWTPYQLQALHP